MWTSIASTWSSLQHGWGQKVIKKLFVAEKQVSEADWQEKLGSERYFFYQATWAVFRTSGSGGIAAQAKKMTLWLWDSCRRLGLLLGQLLWSSVEMLCLNGSCAGTNPSVDVALLGVKCSFLCSGDLEYTSLGLTLLSLLGMSPIWLFTGIPWTFLCTLLP